MKNPSQSLEPSGTDGKVVAPGTDPLMVDVISVPEPSSESRHGDTDGLIRKVAAIDIGTNSTHLLIAAVDTSLGTFTIELAEKSTTRLGERDPETSQGLHPPLHGNVGEG